MINGFKFTFVIRIRCLTFFVVQLFYLTHLLVMKIKMFLLTKTVKGYENSFKEKISKWKILSVLFAVRLFGYSTS